MNKLDENMAHELVNSCEGIGYAQRGKRDYLRF